jgi:peptidoglycan-associated lipoprotein
MLKGLVVAGSLALAVTGCASRATTGAGAGADARGTGAAGAATSGLAASGQGAGGSGAGRLDTSSTGAAASGVTPFPALPSPQGFSEVAGLRDVYFDFDRAMFRAEDSRTLDANARWLLENPGTQVLIEGHADDRGTNEYNLALGQSRARATRDALVSRGVGAPRITLVSYGEERPTCRESNEKCWAQNRRAHFLVKPA